MLSCGFAKSCLGLVGMRASLFIILVACVFFCSCSSPNPNIEVVDHRYPSSTKVLYHVVAPGETLYAIAWRYNLNYKNLAKVNNIGSVYTIYPGQKIKLDDRVIDDRPKNNNFVKVSKPPKSVVNYSPPVPLTSIGERLEKASLEVNKSPESQNSSFSNTWLWPADGPVIEKFEANKGLHKGIDIGGKLGEPVRSASAGEVVYAGEGLRGYGKLIIIKHSEKYLSAYGHNEKVLVVEGDKVTAGQKIARLGSTGTDRVKLHFEIRYEGQPIDPLSRLPKK